MGTTPKGFPFPAATAPVSLGASDIEALARALDSYFDRGVARGHAFTNIGTLVFPADRSRRSYVPANTSRTISFDTAGFFARSDGFYVAAPYSGHYIVTVTIDCFTVDSYAGVGLVWNDAAIAAPFIGTYIAVAADADNKGGAQATITMPLHAGDSLKATAFSSNGGSARLLLDVLAFPADLAAAEPATIPGPPEPIFDPGYKPAPIEPEPGPMPEPEPS